MKAGDIQRGWCLLIKGQPYLVLEREFVNPGKGSSFVRLKLRNVKTGAVLKETQKTQDNVELAEITETLCQFLYREGNTCHFMDSQSFEQFSLDSASIAERLIFMKEGESYPLTLWEGQVLDVHLPTKMAFLVTEAENAIKGDSVTKTMKSVIIETGTPIRTPLFIKKDDKILVNTDTKEYVERVNS